MAVRLLANGVLIWAFACFYFFNSFYSSFLNADAKNTILVLTIVLSAISVWDSPSQAVNGRLNTGLRLWLSLRQLGRALRAVIADPSSGFRIGATARRHLLFALVKLFFIPIMVRFAVGNFNAVWHKLSFISSHDLDLLSLSFFNDHVYALLLSAIFLTDTAFFAFGYLFESERLGNRVRSVDTSFSGWLVALACYPPFTETFAKWVPWHTNDYAWFGSVEVTFTMRLLLVLLLLGYLSASLSLGAKCSNLTNRGIVTTGAYSVVRHPAYVCKNLFWWLVLIPAAMHTPMAVLGMAFWTAVYFLRAITEERHLIQDPDYRAYCQRVRWRFVPGLC